MAFGRLHDEAAGDAKLLALSDSAFRMWACGLIYCQKNLTDGFIADHAIETFGVRAKDKQKVADELCKPQITGKAAVWRRVDGGYQVHDYLDWNDSRDTILRKRKDSRERLDRHRDSLPKHVGDGAAGPGGSPRDHLRHAWCDTATFSRCVPDAVHSKLANLLAPKHGGDRGKAGAALLAWYPTIVATLAPDAVIGEEFKFWGKHFDQAFGEAVTVTGKPSTLVGGSSVPGVAATLGKYL